MDNGLAQFIILASLMIGVLFVPAAYSFPQNLLDQLQLLKKDLKKVPKEELDKKCEIDDKYPPSKWKTHVIYFFYASDLVIFSGGIAAFFSALLGLSMFMSNRLYISIPLLLYLFIIIRYLKHYYKLRKDWSDRCDYIFFTGLVIGVYLVLSFKFLVANEINWLAVSTLVFLSGHLLGWFIPAVHYAPLTELQKLRKFLEDYENKK